VKVFFSRLSISFEREASSALYKLAQFRGRIRVLSPTAQFRVEHSFIKSLYLSPAAPLVFLLRSLFYGAVRFGFCCWQPHDNGVRCAGLQGPDRGVDVMPVTASDEIASHASECLWPANRWRQLRGMYACACMADPCAYKKFFVVVRIFTRRMFHSPLHYGQQSQLMKADSRRLKRPN
jgi:hypothetical protein